MSSYPDFKPGFPKWGRDLTKPLCATLDDDGNDLLDRMLAYDPAGRISAKQAIQHPWFDTGAPPLYAGNGTGYR